MNINGLNPPKKSDQRTPFKRMFERLLANYQLIAFQETRFTDADHINVVEHFIKTSDSKARAFWSDLNKPTYDFRNGVGIVLSGAHPFTEVKDVTSKYIGDGQLTRYLVLDARIDDLRVFIHVVYAPVQPAERKEFFNALPTRYPEGAEHIVVGDLNTPLDPLLDERTPDRRDQARTELQEWMLELGVVDPWRITFPDRRQFTGKDNTRRIDYCLLSQGLLETYYVGSRYISDERWYHEDHLPVELNLASPSMPVSKRLPWKCPRWLLQVPLVQETLKGTLEDLCNRIRLFPGANPGALLDEHKRADREFLRQMQRNLKNKDDEKLRELRRELNLAKAMYASCPSEDTKAELDTAQAELQSLEDFFISRREQVKFDKDVTEGERGTAHFFRPPTPSNFKVAIPDVRRPDGTTTTDADDMAAEHRAYWGALYQSPSDDLRESIPTRHYDPIELQELLKYSDKRLSDEHRRMLDAPMTANDFFYAITKSPKGKSAGFDGLPAEYYQLFPSTWARVYELVYAFNLEHGRMTKFQRRAYISLLYKAGDRSLPSNYRPITLLNHDAKFGPKIQAWRLRGILPLLVHTDQAGFTQGRSIRHELLRLQDLQTLSKVLGLPNAGAVLLDFAKAFDSVLWPALDLVLSHYGFGETFRDWVKTFFKGTLVSVLVNGTPSDYFELGCGVRQGDPLSPALFVLFIEPMLCYLRATTGELGIQVSEGADSHHLLAFADDCNGLLRDLCDAPIFVDAVGRYAFAAGLRLNVNKTHLLPFQPLSPDVRRELEDLGWDVVADDGDVRVLGIYVSPSLPTSARYPRLLNAMVVRCQLWQYRARTLLGRAVILRSIVLPLLWYTVAVTTLPENVAAQVHRLCKAFLFKRELSTDTKFKAPFPQEWMRWPTSKGGLGLPEPRAFSHALQLCSLRDAMKAVTTTHAVPRWFEAAFELFNYEMDGVGDGFDILYAPLPQNKEQDRRWLSLDPFWAEPLKEWLALVEKYCHLDTFDWVVTEIPFWRNTFIRVNKNRDMAETSTNAHRFHDRGFIRVQDFVDHYGKFPTKAVCLTVLDRDDFSAQDVWSRAAGHFARKVRELLHLPSAPIPGPHLPASQCAASHDWQFDKTQFVDGTNHEFYNLVHKLPPIKVMPNSALGVPDGPDWTDHWRRERGLDRDLLPILGDIKFRLQHNGLLFRFKYRYRADAVCVHGCEVDENARHLFWDCPVAKVAWESCLPLFEGLLQGPVTWPMVLYLLKIKFRDGTMDEYGAHNMLRVFNVLRGSVLYILWIHRNNVLFQHDTTSTEFVRCRVTAYVELHLWRMCKVVNRRLLELCRLWMPDLPDPSDDEDPPPPHGDRV